jgi:hypothetical protein
MIALSQMRPLANLGPFDAYDLASMARPDRNDVVVSTWRCGGLMSVNG